MLCTYGSNDGEHRCFETIDEIIDLHATGLTENISIECTAATAVDLMEELLYHNGFTVISDFNYRLISFDETSDVILDIDPDGICSVKSI